MRTIARVLRERATGRFARTPSPGRFARTVRPDELDLARADELALEYKRGKLTHPRYSPREALKLRLMIECGYPQHVIEDAVRILDLQTLERLERTLEAQRGWGSDVTSA